MHTFSLLTNDGVLVDPGAQVDVPVLVDILRHMVRTRALDERAMRLQRTGRLRAYYPCSGQEAHAAIPAALAARDWVFGAYREQGVRLARGVTVAQELAAWRGMPHAAWNPHEVRVAPMNATIGTHLPHAVGYAYAARALGRDEVAVAVFGDGATSEGDFHAALTFAGVWRAPVVFVCQNNQYAQSTPLVLQTAAPSLADKAIGYGVIGGRVDGMDPLAVLHAVRSAVARARDGGGATFLELLCYRYGPHSTYDGTPRYRTRQEEASWAARDPIARLQRFLVRSGAIAETFSAEIREDTEREIDAAMDALDELPPPSREQVFRAATAQLSPRRLAQLRAEQLASGEPVAAPERGKRPSVAQGASGGEPRTLTLVGALNEALADGLEHMPNMLVLGEDVGREGGVFRVTAGLHDRFGAERVIDTPLSEVGIVGAAIGMAMAGAVPVCELEFAGLGYSAFDQLVFHAARYRWRTLGAVALPLVVRMPAGGGHGGFEGHSDSPEALFVHAPGALTVVYPSNPHDAKGLMASALRSQDPVIFLEPVAQYFIKHDGVPHGYYEVPLGVARVVREGSHATIVTYGNGVRIAAHAATALHARGISIELIDLRTLFPWDEVTVLRSVAKTSRLLVVHEAPVSCGLGAEIVATVTERIGGDLAARPMRLGHSDLPWGPATLERYSVIRPERVIAAVEALLGGWQ